MHDAAPGFSLQEHVTLAPYTTFGIGGPARWFTSVATEAELERACAWAEAEQVPIFVLGGGSNILVSDDGWDGLVVRIALRGITSRDEEAGRRIFSVGAGENWDGFVSQAVAEGCAGIECLAGIPGTVGGTPVQNVGAYGQEVAQTVVRVRCFDREERVFREFSAEECGFSYRASRFNSGAERDRYIVTRVEFALQPGCAALLAYPDLQKHFAGRAAAPSLPEVAEAVRAIRAGKGMVIPPGALRERDPDTRSAGSFFKNPVVSEARFAEIAQSVAPANVPNWPAPASDGTTGRKLAAAWLLEQSGCHKGFSLDGAAISWRHTLALTNHSGTASAGEILALREAVRRRVHERFGVELEMEPIFVGRP